MEGVQTAMKRRKGFHKCKPKWSKITEVNVTFAMEYIVIREAKVRAFIELS